MAESDAACKGAYAFWDKTMAGAGYPSLTIGALGLS